MVARASPSRAREGLRNHRPAPNELSFMPLPITMNSRLLAIAVAIVSAAAMAYVGSYQVRAVERMVCPLLGRGCERVADAPFARPFGIPDGFIALGLYGLLATLLLVAPLRPVRPVIIGLAVFAAIGNALGVYDMIRLGAFCFYCVLTTLLSPVLLWAVWTAA
jgi:uncharacterized membrane protein